jgi:hypothetical protein
MTLEFNLNLESILKQPNKDVFDTSIITTMKMRDFMVKKSKEYNSRIADYKLGEGDIEEKKNRQDSKLDIKKREYELFIKEHIAKMLLADMNSVESYIHLFPYYDYRNEFEATKADLLFDSFLSDFVLIGQNRRITRALYSIFDGLATCATAIFCAQLLKETPNKTYKYNFMADSLWFDS